MDSRVSKYNDSNSQGGSRVNKNKDLYKTISQSEIDNFNVMSNATIIGDNKNEIDLDKLKKILDTRYNKNSQRKSIDVFEEKTVTEYSDPEEEDTKEYDINSILNKAREEKVTTYEEDRLKKIRDTQFDILNNLKLGAEEKKEKPSPDVSKKENLLDLINTISINEKKMQDEVFDDLFSELKGTDEDETYGPIEKTQKIEPIKSLVSDEFKLENTKAFKKDNTFSSKEFADLEIDDKSRNVVLEIIIVLVLIAFIVGMFLFFKSMLNF